MPYYPPSPPSNILAEPWPREYQSITIGISRFHGCEVSLPVTMSEAEWAMFDQFIDLVKGAHAATRKTFAVPALMPVAGTPDAPRDEVTPDA